MTNAEKLKVSPTLIYYLLGYKLHVYYLYIRFFPLPHIDYYTVQSFQLHAIGILLILVICISEF